MVALVIIVMLKKKMMIMMAHASSINMYFNVYVLLFYEIYKIYAFVVLFKYYMV